MLLPVEITSWGNRRSSLIFPPHMHREWNSIVLMWRNVLIRWHLEKKVKVCVDSVVSLCAHCSHPESDFHYFRLTHANTDTLHSSIKYEARAGKTQRPYIIVTNTSVPVAVRVISFIFLSTESDTQEEKKNSRFPLNLTALSLIYYSFMIAVSGICSLKVFLVVVLPAQAVVSRAKNGKNIVRNPIWEKSKSCVLRWRYRQRHHHHNTAQRENNQRYDKLISLSLCDEDALHFFVRVKIDFVSAFGLQAFTSQSWATPNACGRKIRATNAWHIVAKNATYRHGFISLAKRMENQ